MERLGADAVQRESAAQRGSGRGISVERSTACTTEGSSTTHSTLASRRGSRQTRSAIPR
jgi:hypothetical protein